MVVGPVIGPAQPTGKPVVGFNVILILTEPHAPVPVAV